MSAVLEKQDSLYRPTLQRREAVVSAHFMNYHNTDDRLHLYSPEVFAAKSIPLDAAQLLEGIVPVMLARVNEIVCLRSVMCMQLARRCSKDYGIGDANKVTAAEMITEALLDPWFRKGPLENVNKLYLRDKVADALHRGEKIRMIIPALPRKVNTPLKTRGVAPCLAEINLLCRLAEVSGIIDRIYKAHVPGAKADGHYALFSVLGDGHRFEAALNVGPQRVDDYQSALRWWIRAMKLENSIEILDYEREMNARLDAATLQMRQGLYDAAHDLYTRTMMPVFDPLDMESCLEKAVTLDPAPDLSNPEGRFVPLFKSVLYTYEDSLIPAFCARHGHDFERLYREITRSAFACITALAADEEAALRRKVEAGEAVSLDMRLKEFFRRHLLAKAWLATIDYLSTVKADRDLMDDPVARIFPDHVRFTIHHKKGHIGLATTDRWDGRRNSVQAWHGVAVLKPCKNGAVKFDNASRLLAEGLEGVPVTLGAGDEQSPLQALAMRGQPLFYVDARLNLSSGAEIVEAIRRYLTRKVFR